MYLYSELALQSGSHRASPSYLRIDVPETVVSIDTRPEWLESNSVIIKTNLVVLEQRPISGVMPADSARPISSVGIKARITWIAIAAIKLNADDGDVMPGAV